MPSRLSVVWEGNFSGTSSLGQVNLELASRLVDRVDLAIQMSEDVPLLPPRLRPCVGRTLARIDAYLRHGPEPMTTPPPAGAWVWMQPWEFGAALPLDWLSQMRTTVDAILVYSPWMQEHLVLAGVQEERVMVVPLGVDSRRFHPEAPPRPLPTAKRFRFLYVGGMSLRKGVDLLLRAYRTAFTADDDVSLVLKSFDNDGRYEPVALRGFEEEFEQPGAPHLLCLPPLLPGDELPGLYTACDAFVHPYRGEGFCLPLAEAMASGLPVITTDRGGAAAFCTQATARLIPSQRIYFPHLQMRQRMLSNFPHWQEPCFEDIGAAMRAIYADHSSARAAAERGREAIVQTFTWDRAAEILLDTLERVVAEAMPPLRFHPVRGGMTSDLTIAVLRGRDDDTETLEFILTQLKGVGHEKLIVATTADPETEVLAARHEARIEIVPGDDPSGLRNHALEASRTQWVCLLEGRDRPDQSFGPALREWLALTPRTPPFVVSPRIVHHPGRRGLPPLERYAPRLVARGHGLRFAPGDPEAVVDRDGLPVGARDATQLVIQRRDGSGPLGTTPTAVERGRALAHHYAEDGCAALEVFREAVSRQEAAPPGHLAFLFGGYVTVAAALGAHREAAIAAEHAERLCSGQPAYWVARGEALLALDAVEDAGRCFHRAIGLELDGSSTEGRYGATISRALAGLGCIAERQGIVENAYRFSRMALDRAPDDQWLRLRVALLAIAANRESEGLALLTSTLVAADDPLLLRAGMDAMARLAGTPAPSAPNARAL